MYSSTSHYPASGPSGRWLRHHARDDAGRERVLDLGRLLLGLTVVALGVLYLLDVAFSPSAVASRRAVGACRR